MKFFEGVYSSQRINWDSQISNELMSPINSCIYLNQLRIDSTGYYWSQLVVQSSQVQRGELIKENKKVRKKERKKTRPRPRKWPRKKESYFLFFLGCFLGWDRVFFLFFCFLDHFLGWKRVFLFSFKISRFSLCFSLSVPKLKLNSHD